MVDSVKNILYIFNDTGFGGAGQSLLDTLAEIRNRMNPVIVIRADADDGVEDKFSKMGVKCYKIPFTTDFVKIGSAKEADKEQDIKRSYEAALQLLPIIKCENIHLIHINSSTSYFAALAALMMNIPYIWHIREFMEGHYKCEPLNIELKKILYKKSDQLIAISDYVQQEYLKRYNIDSRRIYNGLTIARFKKQIKNDREFKSVFLVAGMITPEKGQWDVIRATECLVRKGYSDIKVMVVGNGAGDGYVFALKRYIRERHLQKNIFILPFQNDLSELREKASYAITCSQNEALGRVTIEALLAGHVVIGARSGGTTEIIGKEEERGFLYELHDSSALADAMERAIQCPDDKKSALIKAAQQYAENTFNTMLYCKTLLDLYEEVISSYRPKEQEQLLENLKKYYETVKDSKCNTKTGNSNPYKKAAIAFRPTLKWLEICQKGYSLAMYFEQRDIRKIAIYGMGALGCRLYEELEHSDIEIKHLIDKNPNGMEKVMQLTSLDHERLDVDLIVVTVLSAEKQIIRSLQEKGYRNAVGLSEILNSFDTELVLKEML